MHTTAVVAAYSMVCPWVAGRCPFWQYEGEVGYTHIPRLLRCTVLHHELEKRLLDQAQARAPYVSSLLCFISICMTWPRCLARTPTLPLCIFVYLVVYLPLNACNARCFAQACFDLPHRIPSVELMHRPSKPHGALCSPKTTCDAACGAGSGFR